MGAAAMPIGMAASGGLSFLGGVLNKPRAIDVAPPAPLFPGTQESYVKALTDAGVGPAAFQTIAEGAKTGMPTDVGPFYEAMKAASQRGISEGRTNLIEQFGVGGLRYGSDVMKAGVDYEAQTQKDFASILAGYTQQAQEAAAGRRMQAAAMGQGAVGELATAFRPTQEVVGGGGGLSQGLTSAGGALQNLLMMKLLFGGGGGPQTAPNVWQGGYNAPFEGPIAPSFGGGILPVPDVMDPGIYGPQ